MKLNQICQQKQRQQKEEKEKKIEKEPAAGHQKSDNSYAAVKLLAVASIVE